MQLNRLIIGQKMLNNASGFNHQSLSIKLEIRVHRNRQQGFSQRIGVLRTQAGSIQENGTCRKMAKVSSPFSEQEIIKDRGQET